MKSMNYYQVLGLNRHASPENIKEAFRKLAGTSRLRAKGIWGRVGLYPAEIILQRLHQKRALAVSIVPGA